MKRHHLFLDSEGLALWSAFPTIEIYKNFKKEKRNFSIVTHLVATSFEAGLIRGKNPSDFEALLIRLSKQYKDRRPAMDFSFDTLVAEIKKNISIKQLMAQLDPIAKRLGFERPNEVLFTRLKKDFYVNSLKKHHALMLLAIWLGINRQELGLSYADLLAFPRQISTPTVLEKEGVLVAFSFVGENAEASLIDFLKSEIPKCAQDLKIEYLKGKRLQYLATTCRARFPVREGVSGLPSSYTQAVRDAFFLIYQIFISWQLSPLYNPRINLIIGLEAGAFAEAESSIKDLLRNDLPLEYPIRMSHYAVTLAEQAEQKVIFEEIKPPHIWAIKHFWAFPYLKGPAFLFAPQTTQKPEGNFLPMTEEEASALEESLLLGREKGFTILSTIKQYPPRLLSGLEVANILTYRRLHHIAVRFLSSILAYYPKNRIARSMRMSNFMFLGNYAQDFQTAELFYEKALLDGEFVEGENPIDPAFYAEYSLVCWSKAIKIIKGIRSGVIKNRIPAKGEEIFKNIRKAEYYANKGAIFREFPDTLCTTYLLQYLGFRRLLGKNPDFLSDRKSLLRDSEGTLPETGKSILDTLGLLDLREYGTSRETSLTDQRRNISINNYLNSLSSPSFSLCILFLVCTVLWDFSRPEYQNKIIDQVLNYLKDSLSQTEELKKLCLGVYSLTPAFPVIQSPAEYSRRLNKAINLLQLIKTSGRYDGLFKLFLMDFDQECSSRPITPELIKEEERDLGK